MDGLNDQVLSLTQTVLNEVFDERVLQIAEYGLNDDLQLGMGPEVEWLKPFPGGPAIGIEELFREEYERHDKPTWMHLIREEVAEAFMEDDLNKLQQELIQVAALCVSCVEHLRRTRG